MDALNQLELQILLFIREYLTNPVLDFLMPKITFLADDGWFWIALAIICLIFPKTRKTGAVMGLALIMGLVVCNITLKPLVARIRPYDLMPSIQVLVDHLSDFSFPSGHTVASFEGAFAIFLTQKKRFGVPAIVLASVIAFSRLYLFVHYPTDVLVGVILGTAFGFIAKFVVDKAIDTYKSKKSNA